MIPPNTELTNRAIDGILSLAPDEKSKKEPKTPPTGEPVEKRKDDKSKDRKSAATSILDRAGDILLFHSGDEAYATISVDGHQENHPIYSSAFRRWLAKKEYDATKAVPCGTAIGDALATLAGGALFGGAERKIYTRVAGHDDAVYLDLGDEKWRAVRVDAEGWSIVTEPPVRFTRRAGSQALPTPVRGGSIEELRELINASDDATWRMVIGWLIGAMMPAGPYAILALIGEQGAAKSVTSRMLRKLIDPNKSDLRSTPREERDLMIAAQNSWIVAFDNLSGLSPALSDSLCRLATGGGFSARQLYSDDEEKLFYQSRPILANGIDEFTTRPDLLDRAMVLELPAIPASARRDEATLWIAYEAARPRILGALLSAVSTAISNWPRTTIESPPRMADFARWVCAAEPSLPWAAGEFLRDYRANRESANGAAIESSAIGPAILALLGEWNSWRGTAAELLKEISSDARSDHRTRQRPDWPRSPRGLTNSLRRIANPLRAEGVHVEHSREGHERSRMIRIWRPDDPDPATDPPLVEDGGKVPSAQSAQSANPLPASKTANSADGMRTMRTQRGRSDSEYRPHEISKKARKTPPADDADCADGVFPPHKDEDQMFDGNGQLKPEPGRTWYRQ